MFTDCCHYLLILAFCFALKLKKLGLFWIVSLYTILFTMCFFSAMACYMSSNFSVYNVLTNSNVKTPLLFQISATWSNHEGSLLLWCWLLSLFGFVLCYYIQPWKTSLSFKLLSFFRAISGSVGRLPVPRPGLGNEVSPLSRGRTESAGATDPLGPCLLEGAQRGAALLPRCRPQDSRPRTGGRGGNTTLPANDGVTIVPAERPSKKALCRSQGELRSYFFSTSLQKNTTYSALSHFVAPCQKESHFLQDKTQKVALLIYFFIVLFFGVFLLATSNPFLKMHFLCFNSIAELNPVLQDPVLAIHPPCIYTGYVASAVGFSLCLCLASAVSFVHPNWILSHKKTTSQLSTKMVRITSFIKKKITIEKNLANIDPFSTDKCVYLTNNTFWNENWLQIRIWLCISWCSLTIGILLGSWWAYHELGWGGWWFWDPVENASLMPWLIATACIHSVLLPRLNSWTLFLSILTFVLSVLGTFFVRSGLLASVHSFATDSTRGLFLLWFLLCIVAISTIQFLHKTWKTRELLKKSTNKHQSKKFYFPLTSSLNQLSVTKKGAFSQSRIEQLLQLQNIFLLILTGIVLCGTAAPILFQFLTDRDVSTGAPFFNGTIVPLVCCILLMLIFVHSLLLSFNKQTLKKNKGTRVRWESKGLWPIRPHTGDFHPPHKTARKKSSHYVPSVLLIVCSLIFVHFYVFNFVAEFSVLESTYCVLCFWLFCTILISTV